MQKLQFELAGQPAVAETGNEQTCVFYRFIDVANYTGTVP